MAELVNAQTNTVEDVPQDQVQQSLTAGTHNLAKGAPVNVINPDGQLVSLPAEQVPEALQSNFKIPTQKDISHYEDVQKYETTPEQLKTFGEGVASGATFGTSRAAENYLLKNQQEQKARQEINPGISTAGELTGAVGSAVLAPELSPAGALAKAGTGISESAAKMLANPETSSTVAKILSSAGSKALGSAVEGSVYGLGNQISETALGDADMNAENILHNVGYGALFGGALGSVLGAGESAYKSAFSKEARQMAAKDVIMENAIAASENPTLHVPGSLEDIAKRVETGKNLGFSEELPQKAALLDAEQILAGESQFPAHELQTKSLESPFVRDYYKTFLEGGTKEAQDMQAYEAFQKKEGTKLVNKFIQEISPETKLTDDAVDGGNKLIKAFSDQYEEEKSALKPLFKEFDSKAVTSVGDPELILKKIDEAVPEASNFIHKSPEGYSIVKYDSGMPISKETHGVLKDLVGQLNKENLTIGELRNVREAMRDKVNFLTSPRTANEISSLRKSLLDVIQTEIEKVSPDAAVRDTFRRYAINEENRKIMEKIFGGSISDKASFAKEIKPEDVLSKLFSNTVSIQAAKSILGENFKPAAANYLSQNVAKFTDAAKNGFSSNKLASLLKAKAPELEEALSQNPEQLAKLRAITDKLRILPDSPSVNPSGTAKTSLLQKIQGLGGYLTPHGLANIPGHVIQAVGKHIEGTRQINTINDILAGKGTQDQLLNKQTQYGAFAKIERMSQDTARKVGSGAKAIFNAESPIKGTIIQKLTPEEEQKKFEKLSSKIKDMSSNFQVGVDSLESATKDLHGIAPGISASLNTAAARATQFLAQKLPAQEPSSPFTEPYKPSKAELSKFNRYYAAVEKPISLLSQIKEGTLTKEGMEAVQTVYPKLYSQMQNAVMDQVTTKMAKDPNSVPYSTKLMLSMFTGNDMTNSLKPSNISSAQQVFAMQAQKGPQKASSLSKINVAEQALTPVQSVEKS